MKKITKTEKSYEEAIKQTSRILDAWLPSKIKYSQITGLSVGIVYKGKLVYKKGFGFADIKSKKLATPETVYRIASVSKTFTSIAIMQLAEQGKLKLDDKVEKYLPWFTNKKDAKIAKVPIRQLLSHTAKIWRDGGTAHWSDGKFPTLGELRKLTSETRILPAAPEFKYSNFGFAILGEIIATVSGINYESYVERNILNKLGMKNTSPDVTDENKKLLAQGYGRFIPGEKTKTFPRYKTNSYAAATGFCSNVADLAKYVSSWSLKNTNNLLQKASKQKMMKEHVATNFGNELYGLGFILDKIGDRTITGHSGSFAGFSTQIYMDSLNEIGVVMLSNSDDTGLGTITKGIFETVYKFADEKKVYLSPVKDTSLEKNYKKYEGIYRYTFSDRIIVSLGDKLLEFNAKTSSPLKQGDIMVPTKSKNTFLVQGQDHYDRTAEDACFIFNPKTKKMELLWGGTRYLKL